jgi:hypothetical protein
MNSGLGGSMGGACVVGCWLAGSGVARCVFCGEESYSTLLHSVHGRYNVCVGGLITAAQICVVSPMVGVLFSMVGRGPMVVDGEDMGATAIAVVTRRLINPCPSFAMGNRTMVVVTIQGSPPR